MNYTTQRNKMPKPLSSIKTHIEKGNLSKALDELADFARDIVPLYSMEISQHIASVNMLKKEERLGIQSSDEIRREGRRLSHAISGLIEEMIEEEMAIDEEHIIATLSSLSHISKVSISYSSTTEDIADEIVEVFARRGVSVIRDREMMKYKDNIETFMASIKEADFVIIILSDGYLKSKYCMKEAMDFFKVEGFLKKLLPIIADDSYTIDQSIEVIKYQKYWDNKKSKLNQHIKTLDDIATAPTVLQDIVLIGQICSFLNEFMECMQSNYAKRLEEHREENYADLLRWAGV